MAASPTLEEQFVVPQNQALEQALAAEQTPIQGLSAGDINVLEAQGVAAAGAQTQGLLGNLAAQFGGDVSNPLFQQSSARLQLQGAGQAFANVANVRVNEAAAAASREAERRGRLQGIAGLQNQFNQVSANIQLGLAQLGVSQERLALEGELGRGRLELGQEELGLRREQFGFQQQQFGAQQAFQQEELGLRRELGLAGIELSQQELAQQASQFASGQAQRESEFARELGLSESELAQQQEQFEASQTLAREELQQQEDLAQAQLNAQLESLEEESRQFDLQLEQQASMFEEEATLAQDVFGLQEQQFQEAQRAQRIARGQEIFQQQQGLFGGGGGFFGGGGGGFGF